MVIASKNRKFCCRQRFKRYLKRAEIYSKAGADAILIHSKEKTPSEIFFCERIQKK